MKEIFREYKPVTLIVLSVMLVAVVVSVFGVFMHPFNKVSVNEENDDVVADDFHRKYCTNNVDEYGREQTCSSEVYTLTWADDVVLEVSVDTAKKLGVWINEKLDTGKDFIYADPTTEKFKRGTRAEIDGYKEDGMACYTADDAWSHVGEEACVAFCPEYYLESGGVLYLDEKKDYKEGFVVPVFDGYKTYKEIKKKFGNRCLAVAGKITRYQGHPQIKVNAKRQIKQAKFFAYSNKYDFVYRMDK